MAEKVTGVVKEKYLDTEMDSLTVHFGSTKLESFVSEFPVPEEHPYMVFLSSRDENSFPAWVDIVNPGALSKIENPPLPDLGEFYYGEKLTDLRGLLRLIGY